MEKDFICIVCPKGCRIHVDNDSKITGNTCIRGEQYVRNELTCPKRMLTSTVRINSKIYNRLPVISSEELPKELIESVVKELDNISLKVPVHIHDVIIENVLGTGVNIIATRSIEE
ncbi:MAG: DUF1667 domain-containing protein [Bacilli bacterium]